MQCAPVCETCEELSIDVRCPLDLEKMPNAWKPGDLNEMFTNLTTLEKYKQFEPNVLSRPDYLEGDTEETADYILGPWVVVLENVVTEEEAERLIELGGIEGYKRSSDVGKLKFDGSYESNVNDGRTSMNAWCQHECYNDTKAKNVIQRVTDIANIPEVNSENLQVRKLTMFVLVSEPCALGILSRLLPLAHHLNSLVSSAQLLKYEVGQYYHVSSYLLRHILRMIIGCPVVLGSFDG